MSRTAQQVVTEIKALLPARLLAMVFFLVAEDDRVIFGEYGHDLIDTLTPEDALEYALELAILDDDILADPESYHEDTLAAHGIKTAERVQGVGVLVEVTEEAFHRMQAA